MSQETITIRNKTYELNQFEVLPLANNKIDDAINEIKKAVLVFKISAIFLEMVSQIDKIKNT